MIFHIMSLDPKWVISLVGLSHLIRVKVFIITSAAQAEDSVSNMDPAL